MNFYECISRINSIDSQYQIASSAFDLYRKEEESNLSENIKMRNEMFSEHLKEIKKTKADNNEKFDEDEFKKKYDLLSGIHKEILSYPKRQVEQLKNSMRQNALIFTLSTFEIFLNDLVRHILINMPILLKSNRKVEIGRLITVGFHTLIQEEIERQVYTLGRKSISDISSYFRDHLKIPWGKDTRDTSCTDIIIKINDIRNEIVHKNTDLTVIEQDLSEAFKTCKLIVVRLMTGFVKEYKDISGSLIKQKT